MFDSDIRILLAEDTEITRTITRKMLNKMGFNWVDEATDGKAAWELFQQAAPTSKRYQLVIADWNMPGLNGIELLQKIQSLEEHKHTPFILLTSNIGREHVIEAIKQGVVHYVAKPFPVASLQKKLFEAWEYDRKRRAA